MHGYVYVRNVDKLLAFCRHDFLSIASMIQNFTNGKYSKMCIELKK